MSTEGIFNSQVLQFIRRTIVLRSNIKNEEKQIQGKIDILVRSIRDLLLQASKEQIFPSLGKLSSKFKAFEQKYQSGQNTVSHIKQAEEELKKLQNQYRTIPDFKFEFEQFQENIKQEIRRFLKIPENIVADAQRAPQVQRRPSEDREEEKEPAIVKRYRSHSNQQIQISSQFALNRIKIDDFQASEFLITLRGAYNFEKKQYWPQIFTLQLVDMAAFQLNSLLYLCGGKERKNGQFSNKLICKNYKGEIAYENRMKIARSCVGFGGVNQELAAVGGFNQDRALGQFQLYSIKLKKWNQGPSLQLERVWPGVCFFNSRDVYCFGGQSNYQVLRSIEKISLNDFELKWILLQATEMISLSKLKAVNYKGNIMLFGGNFKQSKTMILSKSGKAERKTCECPLHDQGKYPCKMHKGILYGSYSNSKGESICSYNGQEWKLVANFKCS